MKSDVDKQLTALRVIVGAMVVGIAALCVVAAVVFPAQPSQTTPQTTHILLLILLALPFVELTPYLILRTLVMRQLRERLASDLSSSQPAVSTAAADDPQSAVVGGFATLTIIGAAMVEGIGLFGGVVFLLSGRPVALIAPFVAVAVLLGAILPTKEKLRRFAIDAAGLDRGAALFA